MKLRQDEERWVKGRRKGQTKRQKNKSKKNKNKNKKKKIDQRGEKEVPFE